GRGAPVSRVATGWRSLRQAARQTSSKRTGLVNMTCLREVAPESGLPKNPEGSRFGTAAGVHAQIIGFSAESCKSDPQESGSGGSVAVAVRGGALEAGDPVAHQ